VSRVAYFSESIAQREVFKRRFCPVHAETHGRFGLAAARMPEISPCYADSAGKITLSLPSVPTGSRPAPDVAAALKQVPFADPERSRIHLAHAFAQLSPGLAAMLPTLLEEAPDPDFAILLFDRLVSESSIEITALLEQHNFLAHYAIAVFGHSRYLGETLLQNPELLTGFLRDHSLESSISREEFHEALAGFRSRELETDVSLLLARFKRRQYVRIMLRDVLKIASLAQTTAEISALSDVLIEEALQVAASEVQQRFGSPLHLDGGSRLVNTQFAIISLGKLGGNELNYSSDIDLLYLYGNSEPVGDSPVSQHEYSIRLAQRVTDLLGRVTREGPAFRIDLRLRPQGKAGELAVSLSHCLHYYSEVAQDWERQALIKARYCAGDETLARAFLHGVQAYVYSQEVNFAAIKTALVAREKMSSRRRLTARVPGKHPIDVKLDAGGIRDIEFLVQCLQRAYGGGEPWLRSSGTLFALHKLHDKRHLSGKEFHDLSSGYEFLRRLEHCLQWRHGQQTHRLPEHSHELKILKRALANFSPTGERVDDIVATIQARMAAVAEIYHRIVYQQQNRNQNAVVDGDFLLRATADTAPPEHSDQLLLQRLALDSPSIYELSRRYDLHPECRKNLLRFLSAAFTSSDKYGMLVRNASAVERAMALFATSDYLTDVLVRYPEEIVTLAYLPEDTAGTGTSQLFQDAFRHPYFAADPVLAYVALSDSPYQERLSVLRKRYRQRELAAGARDIREGREVYESLACTTSAAEDAIAAAFAIAGSPAGLSVLALGRLGTREFDLLSDADLLFVANEKQDREALTKAAEAMMRALAAYTQEGMLFPVDPRLRPHGSEGELVVTAKQLHGYFTQEAQAWEALSYTKLRPITGDRQVAYNAMSATASLFERFADHAEFQAAIQEMRSKLENSGGQNLKSSPGGIYDIDFLASYLLISNRVRDKNGTLRDRLWRCAAAGHLAREDAAYLDHAAEFLRTLEHTVRLVTGRARRWLPGRERARERCESLTAAILGRSFPHGLEAELRDTLRQVRTIYTRVLG
jgi:glutamate-ammonia-ligase adenylyltransferase